MYLCKKDETLDLMKSSITNMAISHENEMKIKPFYLNEFQKVYNSTKEN